MNGIINLLKTLYQTNKKWFVVALVITIAFVLVACSSTSGGAPPSGPIGGGCG